MMCWCTNYEMRARSSSWVDTRIADVHDLAPRVWQKSLRKNELLHVTFANQDMSSGASIQGVLSAYNNCYEYRRYLNAI